MATLTGHDAIEYAEAHGLRLRKHDDPTEGPRDDLTPDAARAVAREDPQLIYVEVDEVTDAADAQAHDAVAPDATLDAGAAVALYVAAFRAGVAYAQRGAR